MLGKQVRYFTSGENGKFQNGQEVAVKILSANSGQDDVEFKYEILLVIWLGCWDFANVGSSFFFLFRIN
ncbi:hypothetical protein H5410_027113 [Solanum commersonii]|uniref:Uncharacterized protein n=1 Tax=Solanum commersonii TaxID=4109 RepID=A0A9J5Z0E1_SOLCO|nr:hypothetical protein H5410_027113 [Solanum commersonii]